MSQQYRQRPAPPRRAPPAGRPRPRPVPRQPLKNPGLAAVLSFFIPGVGQIYNGQLGKGLIILLVLVPVNIALSLVVVGFFTGFVTWVWGIYDAYRTAEQFNRRGW